VSAEEFAPTMDSGPVVAHLRRLSAAGVTVETLLAALDLPGMTARLLAAIRRGENLRLDYSVGAAILAVCVPTDDRDVSWTEDAECRKPYAALLARSHGFARTVDMFFAGPGSGRRDDPVRVTVLAMCAVCDVQDDCLDYALAAPSPFPEVGVWGGTTYDERKQLRKDHK